MKKATILMILAAIGTGSFAQSEKYNNAMQKNLNLIDSAKTPDALLSVSATFERIADAEKTQWLPYYYAALTETIYAFMKNDVANNDAYADKADQLLTKAENIEKNNSEIACLRSMTATLRMLVNPMQRWQQYGAQIQTEIGKSKKLDPTNPRPYYLEAQNLKNTPEQFGGGCATAKPVMEEAMKKFEAFKPASPFHPVWGKDEVAKLLASCNN